MNDRPQAPVFSPMLLLSACAAESFELADDGAWCWFEDERAIVPKWRKDRTIRRWLRGAYRSYTDWDQQVVGRILPAR